MTDDWINSRERAVEIVEGQIALASATNTPRIAITVEDAELIITCPRDHCTPEERAVVGAAMRHRSLELLPRPLSVVDGGQYETSVIMERHTCDMLFAARRESK